MRRGAVAGDDQPGPDAQMVLLDFKVMQGELSRVTLQLRGTGEVTRVAGEPVLAWACNPCRTRPIAESRCSSINRRRMPSRSRSRCRRRSAPFAGDRRHAVAPGRRDAVRRLLPRGERRGGAARSGPVHRPVAGLSEQFPVTESTKAFLPAAGGQRFAFRFSGAEFALRVQADNVLPELSVSQVLAYHLAKRSWSSTPRSSWTFAKRPCAKCCCASQRLRAGRLTATG